MFDNIGKKIKSLAKVVCWGGIIASSIIAIWLYGLAGESYRTQGLYTTLAMIVSVAGSLISWVSSFFTYGFGELIDKTCDIERNTRGEQPKAETERLSEIEKLRSQGLISEEEYQQAISKVQQEVNS